MIFSFGRRCTILIAIAAAGCTAGAGALSDGENVGTTYVSFAEFEATIYREPETGVYIVNGDTPLESREQLQAFYEQYAPQEALTVDQSGGIDNRWSDAQKLTVSYCVSTTFAANHNAVMQAMAQAAEAWQGAAHVGFVYRSDQDSSCNEANSNVVFDVRPTNGAPYLARSFFPGYTRVNRNILIDLSSFGPIGPYTLAGILRHELGHTLGFRHEHTRSEAGKCFENNAWRPLTPYDSGSVMHYPQCNGTNAGDLVLTYNDRIGAASLYGISFNSRTSDRGLIDVNGDGKSDLVTIPPLGRPNSGQVYVGLSNGSYFQAWTSSTAMLDADVTDGVYFADVNGDGKSDLVAIPPVGRANSGQVYVGLSNGSYFQAWSSSTAILDADVADNVYFADINGDGKADLVAIPPVGRSNSGRVYVGLSNGSYFQAWSSDTAMLDADVASDAYFADINGDGKADLVAIPPAGRPNSGQVYVGLSNGSYFQAWSSSIAILDADVADSVYFADVNGDGKFDLVTIPPVGRPNSGRVYIGLSNGYYFQAWSSSTAILDADIADSVYFADVNGDGKFDLVTIPPVGRLNSGRVYTGLSNGSYFQAWSSSTAILDADVADSIYWADVDGDHRADMVSIPPVGRSNSGRVYVGLSSGSTFQAWSSNTAMLDADVVDTVFFRM
jgi:FG-GAP-like repeat/FG-GAP repeat